MRIVLFGSGGSIPIQAMRTLRARHEIAAVVRPSRAESWRRWLHPRSSLARSRNPDPFRDLVREHGCPLIDLRSPGDPAAIATLGRVKPDLLCIATFPWLLPAELLRVSQLGALNLHASLLPRHRGRNPWFWVYHSDDRETGVTVHYVEQRADAGAILGQDRFPLARGFPIEQLHEDSAFRGAKLLARCVDSLAAGSASATPQDDASATRAPAVKPGTRMIDFATWPVERVWHFLAGLHSQYREPLMDSRGEPIKYRVLSFANTGEGGKEPGSLQSIADGWQLFCRDGVVNLAREA
jgi:methionyl-tRNA formyltransferase